MADIDHHIWGQTAIAPPGTDQPDSSGRDRGLAIAELTDQPDSSGRDRGLAIAELAARQHGVVARRQLFALGVSRRTIDSWLAHGRLHGFHRGVYAVGHSSVTVHGRWLAAALAAGPDAVLSHRSAAALWELRPASSSRIDVTVAGPARRARRGIAVHLTRQLPDSDRAERTGIPVTSIARTLLDLAEAVSEHQLGRAFEEAERLRLLDLGAIEDVGRRGRGRRGLGALLRVAADQEGPPAPTRSELERAFVDLCREHCLPPPLSNATVAGFEVDALWTAQKLIVELDGYAYHRTRPAFERDRARDARLQLAGYRVLRLTHRRLAHEPAALAETVRSLLQGRPFPPVLASGIAGRKGTH